MTTNLKAGSLLIRTFLLFSFLFFLITIYLELFHGALSLTIQDFIDLLHHQSTFGTQILAFIRIPNVMKAIIAGSCLALSGMFLQTITKNPLAEPYLIGVSSGAGLAIVLGMMLNLNSYFITLSGFTGAILSVVFVISLAGLQSFSVLKLILVGLSFNIFAGSLISAIMLYNPDATRNMLLVLTGGLNSNTAILKPLLILFLLAILVSLYFVPKLNFLILDDLIVKAVTPSHNYYFLGIVLISSLLTSISVNLAGILGFIGIIVPHITRFILGNRFMILFGANILLGSAFVLLADFISRNLMFPLELPLGVIIAMIGAPIFIILLVLRGTKYYA